MIKKTLIMIKPVFKKVKSYKFITILLVVMLTIVTSFYLREKKKVRSLRNIANIEIEEVVSMVGQLIILPEDLKPNIATIENVGKLREKEPNFYKNANNGDKLLIYTDQVILYNPERNIIVNVAPIIPDIHIEESGDNE
jgi:hypothetical protein